MNKFVRIVWVVGAVGLYAAAGIAGAGCGGDDVVAALPSDGGSDATSEAAADAASKDAVSGDSPVADSSVSASDATVDAPADAGFDSHASIDSTADAADTGTADAADASTADADAAKADAATNGATDSSADAADGAVADAGAEASPIFVFATQMAAAECQKLAACCNNTAAFDMTTCERQVLPNGYSGAITDSLAYLDGGVLTFDPAKAQACLNDLAAIDCGLNEVTAALQASLLDDCTAAVTGTLTVGATCASSIQCLTGEYCDTPTDGGAGQCALLQTAGGSCSFGTQTAESSESACSFRGSGDTALRCANADVNAHALLEAGSWVCAPAGAADAGCNLDDDCVTRLCITPAGTCVSARVFVDPDTCAYYNLLADAGSD